MERFDKIYGIVMKHEGGYANNPDDKGGETYCGISRRFHPNWKGWKYIDRRREDFTGHIPTNHVFHELKDQVKRFYHTNYWKPIGCPVIHDEKLCLHLFDTAVNCGTKKAIAFLQKALNVVNNREKLWGDIHIDGVFGPNTVHAVQRCYYRNRNRLAIKAFIIFRGNYYLEIMQNNESQEQFAYAWLNRLHLDVL